MLNVFTQAKCLPKLSVLCVYCYGGGYLDRLSSCTVCTSPASAYT